MDKNIVNEKWEPIANIDPVRRKPLEWARIYLIKLTEPPPDIIWNEYEWAYNMINMNYILLPDKDGDFDKAGLMELRAMELKRDLFVSADMGERFVLEKQYIETEWMRRRISFV
jgi:hypothetical protein